MWDDFPLLHSVLADPSGGAFCTGRMCAHSEFEFESTHCESDIWNPWDLSLPGKSVRGYPAWILEVWGRPTSGVDIEIKLGDREVS